jgi:hypothetical protein
LRQVTKVTYDTVLAKTASLSPGRVALRVPIQADGTQWERLMIKTHVVYPGENIVEVIKRYTIQYLEPGDIVFISEKCTAIAQGRIVKVDSVKPRFLARFLASRIKRTAFGHGLGLAPTMEVAFQEVGTLRMLAAAAAGLMGKLLGRSGDFYRVAGPVAKSIDDPTTWAQPPFNQDIILGPKEPQKIAEHSAKVLNEFVKRRRVARDGQVLAENTTNRSGPLVGVAVVDVNDLGSDVLGASKKVDAELVAEALRDSPLGQGAYQTPLGILRRL